MIKEALQRAVGEVNHNLDIDFKQEELASEYAKRVLVSKAYLQRIKEIRKDNPKVKKIKFSILLPECENPLDVELPYIGET